MEYNSFDLIVFICAKVEGIGKNKAIAVANFFEDFDSFFKNVDRLDELKNANGKQIISAASIDAIKEQIRYYVHDYKKPLNEIWISILIKDFVKRSLAELKSTSLDTLLINPFLVEAFGFDDHIEVVTFYFYQKITRSIVTSWGFTVEGLLICSGAERSELAGFDLMVQKNKKKYHFQIKSSPNTMSIEQVRQLNTHIHNIMDKFNNVPILGMTYGTRDQINSQIQSTLIGYPESTMVGRELWEFITSEKGYCQKFLKWIDEIMVFEPTKFSDELELKKKLLIKEWEKKFGTGRKSIKKVLEKYI